MENQPIRGEVVEGEIEELRAIESALRIFIAEYDRQNEWLWAPRTREMVADVRQNVQRLDELRAPPQAA